ncbi:MAG: transglutaminase-like domain-containing protein [Candidatus Accumulibacter sp.]|nr:transglutaminase-like domain-containing protein [Accumulibacter sp.]
MKRRHFVTASLLALLAGASAQAAPAAKKAAKPTRKTPRPTAKKPPRAAPAAAKPEKAPTDAPRNAISLPDEPLPQWRHYELRATITLKETNGRTRLWLPLVQYRDTSWERSFGHRWQGNHAMAGIYRDPVADMEVFYADWPEGVAEPKLEIVSQFATQDRHFDITRRGVIAERTEILRRCLQATELVPTDGIVRLTAERAIGRIKDPLAQAKAIYDWVVENTRYDPQPRSSGHTHIAALLESGHLTGRSVEISLLFVGLCRSIGIPARPVFGLRMDRSRLFACLGASGELNSSRHCRAEFYSPGYGWVPVNPSDVRQAILDESLGHYDPKLGVLKKLLFGFWEMNWIGFNAAQDVVLQGTTGSTLPYLINPVVETPEGRFDDPASGYYSYSVSAQRSGTDSSSGQDFS